MSILEKINSPDDLKRLPTSQLPKLAAELRKLIITTCAKNGGHLAPSLGVVELTIALHRVFTTPDDKIIWDVGHQAYAHKILTGRRDRFPTLRTMNGISGFPKREESPHDAFDVGHASTSISAASGYAAARDLNGNKNKVLAVIGDGSMTGGIAYEAMNHVGHLNKDLIVILNDNEMSISENVGAFSNFLNRSGSSEFVYRIRKNMESFLGRLNTVGKDLLHVARKMEESFKGLFTPGMLFEAFGFEYIGPIDGHDLPMLLETLENVKRFDGAVLVHVLTKKGKGYKPAEDNPSLFHGVGPFNVETGKVIKGKGGAASYTAIFGSTLCKLAAEDERIVAITAAMPDGTGLSGFAKQFPERFFDVGIAEQHAVTFAAGLAADGLRPVFAVYSSFLQRAYDQVFHDVCLQNLPVTFALDRAGVVGNDGPTHHGAFDISFLRHLPNMTLMAPKDENELQHMLATAIELGGPAAIRYPRGNGYGVALDQIIRPLPIGRAELLAKGEVAAVLAVGSLVYPALEAARLIQEQGGPVLTFINVRFVKPLDEALILEAARSHGCLITLEENTIQGGFGSAVLELLEEHGLNGVRVLRLGYPDTPIPQGEQPELRSLLGLDAPGIAASISSFISPMSRTGVTPHHLPQLFFCSLLLLFVLGLAGAVPAPASAFDSDPVVNGDNGLRLIRDGEYEHGLENLRRSYQLFPLNAANRRNLADGHITYGQHLMKQKHFEQADDNFVKAQELYPEEPVISLLRGICNYYLKRYDIARYELERARLKKVDSIDVLYYLGLVLYETDSRPQAMELWEQALKLAPERKELVDVLKRSRREMAVESGMDHGHSSRFDLTYDSGVDTNFALAILDVLENASNQVGAELGYFPRQRVPVAIYLRADFKIVTDSPEWSGGVYDGTIRLPFGSLKEVTPQIRAVLYHEYAHVVVFELTRGNCPYWLNEGIAEMFGRKQFSHQMTELDSAARKKFFVDFKKLEGAFSTLSASEANLAYQQSYSLVNYLVTAYGWHRVTRILSGLGDGMNLDDALANAFKEYSLSYGALQREWRESIERGIAGK